MYAVIRVIQFYEEQNPRIATRDDSMRQHQDEQNSAFGDFVQDEQNSVSQRETILLTRSRIHISHPPLPHPPPPPPSPALP